MKARLPTFNSYLQIQFFPETQYNIYIHQKQIFNHILIQLLMADITDLEKARIHYFSMFFAWLLLAHLGLWTQFFKFHFLANYLHAILMLLVAFITLMSGYSALVEYGFPPSGIIQFHGFIGIILMAATLFQTIGGFSCMFLQKSPKVSPNTVYKSNRVHRIAGWIIMITSMVPMLLPTLEDKLYIFIPFISISILSFLLYIASKILTRRAQNPLTNYRVPQMKLLAVNRRQDLDFLKGQYFTFGNLVYSVSDLIASHPGGHEIIKEIKGRQVDQYIYGTQQLQSVQKTIIYSHSSNAIKLAGPPIGYLNIQSQYSTMKERNKVTLSMSIIMNDEDIFTIYLKPYHVHDTFYYDGYTSLSQIGRFFTLTINQNINRLYTQVNFLHESNIYIMNQISGYNMQQFPSFNAKGNSSMTFSFSHRQCQYKKESNQIPLIIKKYLKGEFTSMLFDNNFQGDIYLSQPMGQGMLLQEKAPGRFVFFAAGTGLNTFCDLIDLMFKQVYYQQNKNQVSEIIVKQDPIIEQGILGSIIQRMEIYISVQQTNDIHEITAYQLNKLVHFKKASVFYRCKRIQEHFESSFPYLKRVENRFSHYVPQIYKDIRGISQIYACGPTSMTRELVSQLRGLNISPLKYHIL